MNDLPKITDHLEYLFLKKIAAGLRDGSVDLPTAKGLAQSFLKIEPFTSVDDAKTKVDTFAIQHNILNMLKEYIDAYFYEHHKDALIEQMRTHIRAGNIDQALNLVNK